VNRRRQGEPLRPVDLKLLELEHRGEGAPELGPREVDIAAQGDLLAGDAVVPLDVSPHGAEGGKRLATGVEETPERALLGVSPEVGLEIHGLPEVTRAVGKRALEWPGVIMGELVGLEVPQSRKGLATLAGEGALAGVRANVGPEIGG